MLPMQINFDARSDCLVLSSIVSLVHPSNPARKAKNIVVKGLFHLFVQTFFLCFIFLSSAIIEDFDF